MHVAMLSVVVVSLSCSGWAGGKMRDIHRWGSTIYKVFFAERTDCRPKTAAKLVLMFRTCKLWRVVMGGIVKNNNFFLKRGVLE